MRGRQIFNDISAVMLLASALTLSSATAYGKSIDESDDAKIAQRIESDQLARLKGWKKIVFVCDPLEGEKRSSVQKQAKKICEKTVANVKAMVDIAGLDVRVVDDWYGLGLSSGLTGGLQLQVELIFSDCDASFCAVATQLSAEFDYRELVDKRASTAFESDSSGVHPIRTPRSASVQLWSSGVMMVTGSDTDDFTTTAVSGLDSLLKKFFSAYAKANR
jgi:hypothetical protein